MPTIPNVVLALTAQDPNVEARVRYSVEFGVFERRLVGLGLTFREEIFILAGTTGDTIAAFVDQILPVTDGNTPQEIPRERFILVSGSQIGEEEEVRCRVRIVAIGLPRGETDGFSIRRPVPPL